jgi:sarcosine oxidase
VRTADVVIIGQGVYGLAAHAALCSKGASVIALERATPGHEGGSSHGDSRVTRRNSFENPAYTPLFDRSVALLRELEAAPGEIYLPAPVLECGPPDSPLIVETQRAGVAAGAAPEVLTPSDVAARYPAIRLPEGWVGVLQHDGGVIRADRAIAGYLAMIRRLGGAIETGVAARSVSQVGEQVEVVTDGGETLRAGAAIVAAGPWIGALIPELAPHLTLTRQVVGWFRPAQPELFEPGRFPVFLFAAPEGLIYGFPDFAGHGVKIAAHDHGRALASADAASQDADPAEMAPVRAAVRALLPELGERAQAVKTCIYANTADGEFVIDRREGQPRVLYASACSGHGFKFAPALGELLAGLAMGADRWAELAPYRLARFAPSVPQGQVQRRPGADVIE